MTQLYLYTMGARRYTTIVLDFYFRTDIEHLSRERILKQLKTNNSLPNLNIT